MMSYQSCECTKPKPMLIIGCGETGKVVLIHLMKKLLGTCSSTTYDNGRYSYPDDNFNVGFSVKSHERNQCSDVGFLPSGIPGRGYLQVDTTETEMIAAYTSERYEYALPNERGKQSRLCELAVQMTRPVSESRTIINLPSAVVSICDLFNLLIEKVDLPSKTIDLVLMTDHSGITAFGHMWYGNVTTSFELACLPDVTVWGAAWNADTTYLFTCCRNSASKAFDRNDYNDIMFLTDIDYSNPKAIVKIPLCTYYQEGYCEYLLVAHQNGFVPAAREYYQRLGSMAHTKKTGSVDAIGFLYQYIMSAPHTHSLLPNDTAVSLQSVRLAYYVSGDISSVNLGKPTEGSTCMFRHKDISPDCSLKSITQCSDNATLRVPLPRVAEDKDNHMTTELVVSAVASLLANDSDINDDVLIVDLISSASLGQVRVSADGCFTYDLVDGKSFSSVTTATIAIRTCTDAPLVRVESYTTNEDTTLTRSALLDVLSNDSDSQYIMSVPHTHPSLPDTDAVSLQSVQPAHNVLGVTVTATINWFSGTRN